MLLKYLVFLTALRRQSTINNDKFTVLRAPVCEVSSHLYLFIYLIHITQCILPGFVICRIVAYKLS